MSLVRRVIADHILGTQVAHNLVGDLGQLGKCLRKERASTGFAGDLIEQSHRLFLRALANESLIRVELADESDHINLHILFAQALKELDLVVIAGAILAVGYYY